MTIIHTAIAVAALVVSLIPGTAAAVNGNNCACYRTSSDDYFTDYRFHDFRSVGIFNIPELQTVLPDATDERNGKLAEDTGALQEGYISSQAWSSSWGIQNWGKPKRGDAKYKMWNSFSNVFLDGNVDGNENATTKLVLRTRRFAEFQSAAEVENVQKNLLYASTRIRARVTGDSGAVAGLFYYRNGRNESDIEVLTRDSASEIRYSNQPVVDDEGNEIKDASTRVDLNTNERVDGTGIDDKRRSLMTRDNTVVWSDWHTHRLDWVAGKSSWYVDGKHILDKTYGVPTLPSYLVLNMWSDGGVWSGLMKEGGEARLEIEWVEMAFNTSGPVDGSARSERRRRSHIGNKLCCSVDDRAPTISAAKLDVILGGSFDRQFTLAVALGMGMTVVLYIIDTTF